VKAALHRGRTKLASAAPPRGRRELRPEAVALLGSYVERFNRRDWDGLRELVAADARVRVVDLFAGPLADSPYFGRYARLAVPWRVLLADVDGEPMIVTEYAEAGVWTARGLVRLDLRHGRVAAIADYEHCPWVLRAAGDVRILRDVSPGREAPYHG
jgi:RNA polymerase sigma-70 factor (ECF subfamily)